MVPFCSRVDVCSGAGLVQAWDKRRAHKILIRCMDEILHRLELLVYEL